MPQGQMRVRIEGSADALRSLAGVSDIDLFDHTGHALAGERYAVHAIVGPKGREAAQARGCEVIVLRTPEQLDADLDECLARAEPAQPVALVAVRGPAEFVGDLPARFGIDPPLYSARALEDGTWEISTQAGEETIAVFRAAGLDVRVLENAADLARLRGLAR